MLTVWPHYANVWQPVVRSLGGLFERSIKAMRVTVDVPMQGWADRLAGVGRSQFLFTHHRRSPLPALFRICIRVPRPISLTLALSLSLFSAFTKENIRWLSAAAVALWLGLCLAASLPLPHSLFPFLSR